MINTVRCPNNHFYDASRFQVCPYCGAAPGVAAPQTQPQMYPPVQPSQSPQSVNHMPPQNPVSQPAMPSAQPVMVTQPFPGQPAAPSANTANIFQQFTQSNSTTQSSDSNKQPTVGWLVCIGGSSKGKSFAIRENRNFIGRSPSMDIAIVDDNSISREKHGIITYVPKQRFFLAQPGESRELFYVNDKVVLDNVELSAYDKLEIGKSTFLFVPLCGSEFSWDDYSRDE